MNAKTKKPQHTNTPPAQYKGNALAKQEPGAKPATITGRMREANVAITAALKGMADLMSDDMPVPALTGAYFLMRKEWNPILKRLDEAANKALKETVTAEGKPSKSEGGGEVHTMDVDFSGAKFRCVATQSLSTVPDTKALAVETGLKESAFLVEQVSYVYSQDKIDKLLAEGKIKQEQIDKCRKAKSVSLKVEKL